MGDSTRPHSAANGTRDPQPGLNDLEAQVARLEAEIEELKRRLPRHSVRPAMLIELEELEEELEGVKEAAKGAQSHGRG